MPSRPSWEGFLKFNLISVPVKAFNAMVAHRGRISFHLIHAKCNSRVHYKKVCPIHGEVDKDEIVSGYEYAKGQYVIVDPEELEKFRSDNEKAINVDLFIKPAALDPIYLTDRSYYLIPDGKVAQKPYSVLQQVMEERDRYAIAKVVFSGREQVVVLRPSGKLLAMTFLSYDDQVKRTDAFAHEVATPEVAPEEHELAENLIEASTTKEFNFSRYKDDYQTNLAKFIEAKAKGKKLVTPPAAEEPRVINLMDALRQSLKRAKAQKPDKKTNPVSKTKVHAHSRTTRRRKTG